MIRFYPEDHSYKNVDSEKDILWRSVSSIIGLFKPKFDVITTSEKSAKNKNSKW